MATYLDLDRWPRRAAFEHFRAYDNPYFNLCTSLDVTALRPALDALGGVGINLACHYLALRRANELEAFRYRLEDGRVRVHEVVHGSTTVLCPDDSIAFADLPYTPDFAAFAAEARRRIDAVRRGEVGFDPRPGDTAVVHFTTLPWVAFTSFSHARNWRSEDAVPKVAFGRLQDEGGRARMALGLEVHHALMDGLDVGRFVQGLERWLENPLSVLQGGA